MKTFKARYGRGRESRRQGKQKQQLQVEGEEEEEVERVPRRKLSHQQAHLKLIMLRRADVGCAQI